MNNTDWILPKSRTQTHRRISEDNPSINDTYFLVMDVGFERGRLKPIQELVDELNTYYQEELGATENWTTLTDFLLQLLLERCDEVDAFDSLKVFCREQMRMEDSPIRALREG